ncbi:MAG: WXG100 family type VII secretion target [Propionibacterium sp.]|nr:WXG100 family type VII secretion target [Propionibacterium sp.]MDN6566208.1 WXG100 family type VII secretion target [Actinomyces sp.]MDN6794752.1 WXG100 family type VII secretion target [Propionibacterium sp.]
MDLKVNYGTLDGASQDLSTGATHIQGALDTMDQELQQLKSNWEGDAQQAYEVAKQRWTEGMNGMRDVLAKISQLVATANQSYNQTDHTNANRFN